MKKHFLFLWFLFFYDLLALSTVCSSPVSTPNQYSSVGKDDDILAKSVEELPPSVLISLDKSIVFKFSGDQNLPMMENLKSWKFNEIYKLLPKNVQSDPRPNLSADETGNLWTVDNILFDGISKKVLFQATQYNDLQISNNGQYLYVRSIEGITGGEQFNGVYKIPQMTKIPLDKDVTFSRFLGQGRYAVVEAGDQGTIVDLKKPNQTISNIDSSLWGDGICESQDGRMILKQEYYGISLYNLPDFSLIKDFPEIKSGSPFINSTGTIIGCNSGTCYLINRSTGEAKGYGITGINCQELVDSDLKDDVFKKINLSTLQTVQQYESAESSLWPGPTNGKSCGVYYVITPQNSPDVWLIIIQFNSFETQKRSGQSWFLKIGEDLKINRVLHLTETVNGASWDNEMNSIMGNTYYDKYFKIKLSP